VALLVALGGTVLCGATYGPHGGTEQPGQNTGGGILLEVVPTSPDYLAPRVVSELCPLCKFPTSGT
jgi:hypothetical protein